MRVVVDTNVLISAAIRDRLPERVIVWIAGRDGVEWVVSSDILDEYAAVMERPKFALPPEVIERWRELLARETLLIDTPATATFPRDQGDAKFLACARAAGADYFVTGDTDFAAAPESRTRIVTVAEFARLVGL
jgi:uncharacterized protein